MAPYYSTVLLFILGLVSLAYKHSKIIKSKKLPVTRGRDSIHDNVDDSNSNLTFNITVLTWNLAEATPTESNYDFLRLLRSEDMVVIGVQECENIKPRRHEGSRSRAWRKIQHSTLGKGFECLALHKMGGIQLAVFAKPHIAMKVREIQIIDVACGVGNVLMNKGAIAILLRIQRKTVAFINAHLAAHLNKVEDRNEDYCRIISTIKAKAPPKWLGTSPLSTYLPTLGRSAGTTKSARGAVSGSRSSRSRSSGGRASTASSRGRRETMHAAERSDEPRPSSSSATIAASLASLEGQPPLCPSLPFDGSVFFGDLNYRLELPRLEVELVRALHPDISHGTGSSITALTSTSTSTSSSTPSGTPSQSQAQAALQSLLDYDQLRREKGAEKVLVGFQEGNINFLPTFKYDKGSDAFDSSSKQRVPAWTDRILYSEAKRHRKERRNRSVDVSDPATAGSSRNRNAEEAAMNGQKEDATNGAEGRGCEPPQETARLFQLRRYTSIDARHGDHRPVCAQFLVTL